MTDRVRVWTGVSGVTLAALNGGCGYDVKVGKYEEHGPTITQRQDGSTETNTGGKSFKLVEVTKSGESNPQ